MLLQESFILSHSFSLIVLPNLKGLTLAPNDTSSAYILPNPDDLVINF